MLTGNAERRPDSLCRVEVTAVGFGGRPRLPARIVALDWHPITPRRNTLLGFVSLQLPSGLVLRDCAVHQKGDRRWIGLPGKAQIDSDGRHRTDASGKRLYTPTVEIPDSARRERFQAAALAAVDQMLGAGLRAIEDTGAP